MATSVDLPVLKWKRPVSDEYPKVWHAFKARDIGSDNLVEYRIQDLPLDRIDDLFEHLLATFIPDEPIGQALGYENDPLIGEDYKKLWTPAIAQRMALVCFKEGSNEIVGTNVIFISSKGDNYFTEIRRVFEGCVASQLVDLVGVLYENYDTHEAFKIDEYMSSLALSVDRRYRGRGIGDQFLMSRRAVCQAFGIKVTQTSFTSDFSNANADKAGYKTDVALRYMDIVEKYPKYKKLLNIKSKQLTLKSLVI